MRLEEIEEDTELPAGEAVTKFVINARKEKNIYDKFLIFERLLMYTRLLCSGSSTYELTTLVTSVQCYISVTR